MKIVLKVLYLAIILGIVAACTPAPSTPLEILEAEADLSTDTIVPIKTPTNVLLPTLTPEVEHIPTETPESDQTLRKRLKSHERTNCFSIRLIIAT